MQFFIENWWLILVAAVSAGMLMAPVIQGGSTLGGVTSAQAIQLINREKGVVIDVCGADEYAGGHIAGAKNIPLGELQSRLPQVVKNKATPVILACASGARSRSAVAIAKGLGYESAQSLTGGLKAWREANLPIEKA